MKIIVGLGNPEPEYNLTRHNIGFMCLNYLAEQYHVTFTKKFDCQISELFINQEKVILVKPYTYMNRSGSPLAKVIKYYNCDLEDIIVVYDELALDFPNIKLKYNSSHGGHNGMRDIINCLKSKEIFRIKVGINSPYKKNGRDFVLGRFSKEEQLELTNIFNKTLQIVELFVAQKTREEIMNKFN